MDRIENILDTGGRYLSSADRQFVSTLLNELEQFQYQAPKDRALMFHPLGGFQRYLIHKVTEVFPKLTSFSIGDDSNRRTVVCFKGKKRDQQQDLQAVGNRAAKPDHPAPPPNTSVDEGRGTRSRDSSRSRKKPEKADSTDYYARPTNTGSLSHLPKPLRNKKTSTKRDKMKRSRSLQSSPVHMNEHDPVEENVRQGRRPRSTDAKRMPRSASLKPLNRKRETELSDVEKRSNTAPRRNVSEVSLHRRGQGLRMEGRVINGDVEDPYSCGDSCSDQGRVDAEALKKEKKRHADKTHKHRKHQQPPRSRHHSNSSVESADSFLTNEISHRSGHGAKGVNDDSDVEMKLSSSQEGSTTDGESTGTDEHPPSYSSLKPVASVKKAERNLGRIKRADSVRSGAKSDRDHRDSSSSNSSKRLARHASSKSTPKHERKSTSEHRSSTMPRAPSSDPPLRRKSDKRSQTLKGSGTARNKEKVINAATLTEDKLRKRPSSASGRRDKHHRVKPSNSKGAPSPGSLRVSTDDLLDGSNTTLYMPLPSNKSEEKRNKSATKGSPAKHSSPPMMRCDSGAQTEVSGTLSRKPTRQPSSSSMSHPEAASNPEKHPNDLLAAMVQYLGLQPPGSTAFQSPLHQNSVNAFQQYLSQMNHQLNSQHPTHVPSLPAHLSHQLYLSWLGAYYAGAAGTWPPPAPPAFLMPHLAAAANSGMPTFDMPPYTGYSPQHEQPRYQEPKGLYEHFNVPSHQEPFNGDDGLVNGGKQRAHPSGMENTAKSGVGDFMKRQNYPGFEAPAFGADYNSYSSNPAFNQPKKQEEDLSHEDESLAPTDEESGAGEVAVTSSSKGGLMVYVRSRSTSRTSSTTGTRGSVESLNVSDNMHSPSCTSRNSELSCRSSASGRKKSSSKSPKLRKSAPSKQAKNAAPDDVLLIDDTSEDDAPDNDLNGSAQSDASTISDGGAPHDVSDSSYDADQSRFDDSRDTRAPTDALFKEVDGDIVVQDPQFDYYAWQPKEDEFAGEQYLKFVEVSGFPADVSDISVTQKLSKYRGLRLTRVDPTHALCLLTSKEQAVQLLNDASLPFATRALCEAAAKTKQKAKEKLESIQFDEVRSQRPKSSAVVARRMIAGALGDSKFAPHDGAKSKRERSLKKGKPESR